MTRVLMRIQVYLPNLRVCVEMVAEACCNDGDFNIPLNHTCQENNELPLVHPPL